MKKIIALGMSCFAFLSIAVAQIKAKTDLIKKTNVIKASTTQTAQLIYTSGTTMMIHESGKPDDVRTNLQIVWTPHSYDCAYTINIKAGKKIAFDKNDNIELNINVDCYLFGGFDAEGKFYVDGGRNCSIMSYGEITGLLSNVKDPKAEQYTYTPTDIFAASFSGKGITKQDKRRFVNIKTKKPVTITNTKTGATRSINVEFKNLQIPNII